MEENKGEEVKPSSASKVEEAERQFAECNTEMKNVRKGNGFSWDEKEELFFGGYFRAVSEGTKKREKYMDSSGELTTQAIDRACRVMGQLPTGHFENLSGDTGKNLLMNLIFENHVIPNANTGGSIKIKLRMVDLYSDLYSIPVFAEWKASKDGYTGPDFVIIDPRRFYPQAGKGSIAEMDFVFLDTFVSKEWLLSRDERFFKNLKEIADKAPETGPETAEVNATDRLDKQSGIRIRHKLTKEGDWFAYNPDTKLELIDEKKFYPRIPVSMKHQIPKIGRLWSFTNFDRGMATQKKIDSLGEANLKGVEMMMDPPYIMDPADMILSSFKKKKGGKWFVKNGKMDSIKAATVHPQALSAYAQSYQIQKANLQSMASTTDTSIAKDVDPGFGKSPEALKRQGMRQGARDTWDEDMMQDFIEDIFSIMADMVAKMGVDKYCFTVMAGAIKNLKEDYPKEAAEFDSFIKNGKAEIEAKKVEGLYRYKMVPGSTLIEQEGIADAVIEVLKLYAENPQIKTDLEAKGETLDYGAAFKLIIREKGSKFADKIIISKKTNPESTKGIGPDGATVETPPAGTEETVADPALLAAATGAGQPPVPTEQ